MLKGMKGRSLLFSLPKEEVGLLRERFSVMITFSTRPRAGRSEKPYRTLVGSTLLKREDSLIRKQGTRSNALP